MNDHLSAPTKVKKCSCSHEFQDNRYGQGMRLHNPKKGTGGVDYKCSVCGQVKGH